MAYLMLMSAILPKIRFVPTAITFLTLEYTDKIVARQDSLICLFSISMRMGAKSDADILKINIPSTEITGCEDSVSTVHAIHAAENKSLMVAASPKRSEIL